MKKIGLILVMIVTGTIAYQFLVGNPGYKIRNIPLSVTRIVCFGDSLTSGVGSSEGMDYPSRLAEMTGVEVINSGVPGNTTADGLARLNEDVLAYEPEVVLITLGGNDLKNRLGENVVRANLVKIIKSIHSSGAMVVLGGIDIPIYGGGFAEMYESVARETGVLLVPNIFKGMFGKSHLMSDPIHPNNDGYEIMAGYFFKALLPYLNQ